MKAELLISISSAHGIDLERAAKMSSREKPAADVVPGKRGARVLVPPPKNRVKGSETRTMVRPRWTVQEIGQASANVPEAPFRAALYAFAGAHEHLWWLHGELIGRAKMFSRLYHWPALVKDYHGIDSPYIAHLCRLVLDEDANPVYFRAAPSLYGIYMRVTDRVWEKTLEPCYREVKWAWADWLGSAARMIQAKLSEAEEYG
jgi:hypothetical protein